MNTLTLATIRNLIRSDLNEATTTMLSDTELNSIINDGYKDTAVKGLCYENKIAKTNINVSEKVISLLDQNPKVIRVNYVEYKSGTTQGGKGLMCIQPQAIGHIPISGNAPQYWFQWGDMLVIEPLPDVGTYDLAIYASCIPTPVLSADSDVCSDLPSEFHECVYYFALAIAAVKLKRWSMVATYYNKYIVDVQTKREQYAINRIDSRSSHTLPDAVQMEAQGG
jgi:hypothetical protein